MSEEKSPFKFSDVKAEFTSLIDSIILKNLEDQKYDKEKTPETLTKMVEEIISTIKAKDIKFKFICQGSIFKKGYPSLYVSSHRLLDPETDGSLTVKYENNEVFCFISLYGIEPNFVEIVKKEDKKE